MNPDDIIALNEQIAGMARAGLPLDQGLASLAKDMSRGSLRTVTEALARDLRSGLTLADALERQGEKVPPYYSALVTAGVRSGRLPEVLATLTEYARTVAATRSTVIEALMYPAIVLVFGFALTIGLTVFVLPRFDEIYKSFGMKLPAFTEFVMLMGRHPVEAFAIPIGTVGLIVLAVWISVRVSPKSRQSWTRFLYRLPVIGQLIRSARLATFANLLGTLVEHELPLPQAFKLASAACADPVMAAKAGQVEEKLSQGVPLAEAFRGKGILPEWVAWMAGTGEQRGSLAKALRGIVEVYRRQVQSRAAVLRTVLPSFVVILTAGFLTCFFATAVMLPMIKLLEGLSK